MYKGCIPFVLLLLAQRIIYAVYQPPNGCVCRPRQHPKIGNFNSCQAALGRLIPWCYVSTDCKGYGEEFQTKNALNWPWIYCVEKNAENTLQEETSNKIFRFF